jgi:hypothetical protein
VAAPDGSAVFASKVVPGDGFEVLRIDPRTGEAESVGRHVPGPPGGVHVAAVEPGGERLVLASPVDGGARTLILDFDPAAGGGDHKPIYDGVLEPEALSLDRTRVFAARIYEDRYHVHVLDLATATQAPLLGPDKTKPPEDMYGSVVQAALSPDGGQLATLYRDSTTPDHTAFVHLLDLDTGATVCIDLHEPFGTAGPGTDALAWRGGGTVAVGHVDGEDTATATFDPAAIWAGPPQEHYHAEATTDAPPTVPAGVAATPGFVRFVALATG